VANPHLLQGAPGLVGPTGSVRIAPRRCVRRKAKGLRIGAARLGGALILPQGLAQRELVGREFRGDPNRRLRFRQRRLGIAWTQRPARGAQKDRREQAVRAGVVDRRIGARGAPQQVGHARQRVLRSGAALPRLQTQSGGQPVVAGHRRRRILLAELADLHRTLREPQPLGAVLLAPEPERLGADGAGERLGATGVGARRLQIEVLGSGGLSRLSPPRPGGIGFGDELGGPGPRGRGDRFDRRRLVERARAGGAEEERRALHCARRQPARAAARAA